MLRVLGTQRRDVGAVEQRPGAALAGVAEGPGGPPVGGGHRHLERVLHAVTVADLLDEPRRCRDGCRRVLLQAEGEGEEEEQLRVRGALDQREQPGLDGQHEVALEGQEVLDEPVVHPQPVAVTERMAVGLLHRSAGGGPDVREDVARRGLHRQFVQVAVVPGGLRAAEQPRRRPVAVPADAEAVPVGGLHAQARVLALHDQGVGGFEQQVLQAHGRTRVRQPAEHVARPLMPWGPPPQRRASEEPRSGAVEPAPPPRHAWSETSSRGRGRRPGPGTSAEPISSWRCPRERSRPVPRRRPGTASAPRPGTGWCAAGACPGRRRPPAPGRRRRRT